MESLPLASKHNGGRSLEIIACRLRTQISRSVW